MGAPGSTPNVTREDVRRLFSQSNRPTKPVSAAEVAEKLGCTRQIARDELAALAERGELETTEIDGTTRVWWRSRERTATQRSDPEEFSAFVNAVKDYAIFTLDPDGTVASWNDGAERIKRYEETEIVGEHVSTFYTESDSRVSPTF